MQTVDIRVMQMVVAKAIPKVVALAMAMQSKVGVMARSTAAVMETVMPHYSAWHLLPPELDALHQPLSQMQMHQLFLHLLA
jgi:hypothetical protein